ncbi:MAG: hypothetical protein ACYTE3_26365, partial [Planctomycetota bacterium]
HGNTLAMGTIPKSFGLEAATQGSLDGKGQCRKICTDTDPTRWAIFLANPGHSPILVGFKT